MKHLYIVFAVFFCSVLQAQVINFPDANFKAKLLQANPTNSIASNADYESITIDVNGDGEIQVTEAANVYVLEVQNSSISDLSGISGFTNLRGLNCSNNSLTAIPLDSSFSMTFLDASHNSISEISMNFGDNVEGLDLSYNNLTSFTAQGSNFWDTFNLSHNQLTSLVMNDVGLDNFNITYNNLSQIQFSGNVWFFSTSNFSHNEFTLLDLSNASFMYDAEIILGYNTEDRVVFHETSKPGNITYSSDKTVFDMGNFHSSTSCDPENTGNYYIQNCPNLQNIIFKNGIGHGYITCNEGGTIFQNPSLDLQISNCPNLSHICVDEGTEQDVIQERMNQLGLQNQVQVNSYCTFTPGGTFYTVTGTTRYDSDTNGCNASDAVVPNQKFTITNGTQTSTIIANDLGSFSLNVGEGTHTVTPQINNPGLFSYSPASATVEFPVQGSPFLQDFCVTAGLPFSDFDITLIPLNAARPGFDANYRLVFKNTGNTVESGTMSIQYPDDVLDFVSASLTPVSTVGMLSWTYTDLQPFETGSIDITFNLNSPMETPPLNANDVLHFTSSIGEEDIILPWANEHVLDQVVVNSFDPNDKVCLDGESLDWYYVGNYVSYKIRFENTGTFAAENIVVKDIIDPTQFDIATLTPIAGSHDFYTRITGDKAEFVFENINLPFDDANNDGFVVFKIKLKPGVQPGMSFSNQASIYFDYNFPIITNTATSTISVLGTETVAFDGQFVISPVPAKTVLNIMPKSNMEINSMEIYNSLGQIVQKELGNNLIVDVSRLPKGSYFIRIKTGEGSFSKSFLKE